MCRVLISVLMLTKVLILHFLTSRWSLLRIILVDIIPLTGGLAWWTAKSIKTSFLEQLLCHRLNWLMILLDSTRVTDRVWNHIQPCVSLSCFYFSLQLDFQDCTIVSTWISTLYQCSLLQGLMCLCSRSEAAMIKLKLKVTYSRSRHSR